MTAPDIPRPTLTPEQAAQWEAEMEARLDERRCNVCRKCKGCRRGHAHCRPCWCEVSG